MSRLNFFPEQASTEAPHTDLIYFGLIGFSLAVTLMVVGLLIAFAVRYRRGSGAKRGTLPEWIERDFEIGWTSAAFFLFLFAAFWTGATRLSALTPPSGAMEIHIVAKQWMWKTQHPNGAREINALHVPVGEPVRLAMTSEDVIHSFFAPAFRIKQDVLPGRYTRAWFNATKVGAYHLLCTQLCGTEHARMIGDIIVMSRADFSQWLAANRMQTTLSGKVRRSLRRWAVRPATTARPKCARLGLTLSMGGPSILRTAATPSWTILSSREMILRPSAHVVRGYDAIMPSYLGLVGDDELLRLSAFIRSLGRPNMEIADDRRGVS